MYAALRNRTASVDKLWSWSWRKFIRERAAEELGYPAMKAEQEDIVMAFVQGRELSFQLALEKACVMPVAILKKERDCGGCDSSFGHHERSGKTL